MSTPSSKLHRGWVRGLLFTTLLCMVIAGITRVIWTGPYYQHLFISLGFGYSSVFCTHFLRFVLPGLSSRLNTLFSMGFAIVAGTVHAHFWLRDYAGYQIQDNLSAVLVLGVLFTGLCFTYFYHYEQKLINDAELQKARRKESESEKALVLSQLNQLQSQIEPHFLFNTLANISVLIDTDSVKAKEMLNRLTDLLRANLKSNRDSLTTVRHEIDMISAYLGIQQVRLGERLSYKIECDDAIKEMEIPPLLIQPLVENAVTHGIETKPEGGEVSLTLSREDENLHLRVSDSGTGLSTGPTTKGHGIGLSNIRERLEMLFDSQAELSIVERENGGVNASIRLPVQGLTDLKRNQG